MKEKIKETVVKFTELMLKNYPDVQSIKLHVLLKDKVGIKYKKFRENQDGS